MEKCIKKEDALSILFLFIVGYVIEITIADQQQPEPYQLHYQ